MIHPKATLKTYAFSLSDVSLLSGPFQNALQRDVAYILQLDPDRFLGHYLSACAMDDAATGDQRFKEKWCEGNRKMIHRKGVR